MSEPVVSAVIPHPAMFGKFGERWGFGETPRFKTEDLIAFSKKLVDVGGMVARPVDIAMIFPESARADKEQLARALQKRFIATDAVLSGT